MTAEMTKDQAVALDAILTWFPGAGERGLLTLGGYAGTGKTFTISQLPRLLPGTSIRFCAPTGKAASQLRRKMPGVDVRTIHSLLYQPAEWEICGCTRCPEGTGARVTPDTCPSPRVNVRGIPVTEHTYTYHPEWERDGYTGARPDLIVADEASMIGRDMFADLQATGLPLLAVGDHGQLKPVKSDFSLMASPVIRLETIVRQKAGDPIIQMSVEARNTGDISYGQWGPRAFKIYRSQWSWEKIWQPGTLMITARRKTRRSNNAAIRAWNMSPADAGRVLLPGEPVICLKNNRLAGVYNGETMAVAEVHTETGTKVVFTNVPEEGERAREYTAAVLQFGEVDTIQPKETPRGALLFDHAYAITCHKAQGSEAARVIVVEENWPPPGLGDDRRRWLYTAVTRAVSELIVVGRN